MINQAIKLSDAENGRFALPKEEYSIEEFYNIYLAPYIKTVKTEKIDKYNMLVYFPDGSGTKISNIDGLQGVHFTYSQKPKNLLDEVSYGKDQFLFHFNPTNYPQPDKLLYPYGVQPYDFCLGCNPTGWKELTEEEIDDKLMNSNRAGCKNGDGGYCTAVIMRNGWKIPKDYPWKF